jgi:hypothetical protein
MVFKFDFQSGVLTHYTMLIILNPVKAFTTVSINLIRSYFWRIKWSDWAFVVLNPIQVLKLEAKFNLIKSI